LKAPIIHIEGMDLAGKTTARNRLAKRLGGWAVRSNRLSEHNEVYDLADRLRREDALDAESLGHLFVAALAADLRLYQPDEQPLIQDSTILLRSLAYHRVNQTSGVVVALERLLPYHPRFATSVVLTASIDARRQRLEMRRERAADEVAPDDLLIEQNPAKFIAMERELIEVATTHFDAKVVDTSDLDEAAVTREIVDLAGLTNTLQLRSK
jgi:thymidylate kinase